MGVVPREELVASVAPFADAARLMWGPWAATVIVARGDAVVARRAQRLDADDGPGADGRGARTGCSPRCSAGSRRAACRRSASSISAALATALVLVQVSGGSGFSAIYNMIVSLSTMAAVIPYVFCSLAAGSSRPRSGGPCRRVTLVEAIAFVFAMFTVYGCGPEPVLYGLVLLLLGVPVYVWQRREHAGIVTAGSTP